MKADATKFSETGYVGNDVDDIVRDLVKVADGNVDLPSTASCTSTRSTRSPRRSAPAARTCPAAGVQTNLLKLMEDTEVNLVSQTDMVGQMQAVMDLQRGGDAGRRRVSTRHLLFIVSGAFMGMTEQIQRRVGSKQIGFASEGESGAPVDPSDYLQLAETRDFIEFGFEPEFIGRLPVRVACESLDAGDLRKILTQAEGNILEQYIEDFRGYGIDVSFTDGALREIAERAALEETGARGLMTVLERVLRDFKFHLPSTVVRELRIDETVISEPGEALESLIREHADEQWRLLDQEVREFAERFQELHGIELRFTPEAVRALIRESEAGGRTARAVCEQKFKDYQYGLKLVGKNTGQTSFDIDEAGVEDPDTVLSEMVLRSYNR